MVGAFLLGRGALRLLFSLLLITGGAGLSVAGPYYPTMQYGPKQELAPGVTWQTATHLSPRWSIQIIEVDMTSPSVQLMPVFKQSNRLEKTSAMAERVHAIAAVNAGYFNTKPPYNSVNYTMIDGQALTTETARWASLGFWGHHQARAVLSKVDAKGNAEDRANWSRVLDAIGGRGYFLTRNGVVEKVDNDGPVSPHNTSRHPRTVIGYRANPYRVWLVTVDGRQQGHSVGMSYKELAQLMADLGAEVSLNLDGGGSTTAWINGKIVNRPSVGRERSVVSAWAVVPCSTVDNRDAEVTLGGNWTPEAHPERYNVDHYVATGGGALSWIAWRPQLKQDGLYQVEAWWTDDPGRAAAAPFQIKHRDGQSAVLVNQQTNGKQWNTLGTFNFAAGSDGLVMLSNTAPGTISADAVRFIRVGDAKPR